jgi:hypothetical protein
VRALGYHLVHYDLNTEDYMHPSVDHIQLSKNIVKDVIGKAPKNGNLMALQHDIIPQSSGNLTEFILRLVRDKGWKGMSASPFHASHLLLAPGYSSAVTLSTHPLLRLPIADPVTTFDEMY